jgi:hypothetical protein
MVRKPRRVVCRGRLSKRMHVRIPPTSHSLRQVLLAVCRDGQIPLHALHQLNERIRRSNTDEQNWSALTSTLDRIHVLRALSDVCDHAQTGPVTAFVIGRLLADAECAARKRTEAQRDAVDVQLALQRSGQAFLASCEKFL